MKSFSSRIWTRVAVSISYDDKHYTTGTSFPEASSLKVSIVAVLMFELIWYAVAVQQVGPNGTLTHFSNELSSNFIWRFIIIAFFLTNLVNM